MITEMMSELYTHTVTATTRKSKNLKTGEKSPEKVNKEKAMRTRST